MKIYNKLFPLNGFLAMTIWPFMFIRKEYRHQYNAVDENHETIHACQQVEFLVTLLAIMTGLCLTCISWWWMVAVPFGYFLWYGIEYVVRYFVYGDAKEAYRNISFEQEAFLNERNFNYLVERMYFAWIKYLTKKTYRR